MNLTKDMCMMVLACTDEIFSILFSFFTFFSHLYTYDVSCKEHGRPCKGRWEMHVMTVICRFVLMSFFFPWPSFRFLFFFLFFLFFPEIPQM